MKLAPLVNTSGYVDSATILRSHAQPFESARGYFVSIKSVGFELQEAQRFPWPALGQVSCNFNTTLPIAHLAARQGEFREKGIDTRTYIAHGPIVAEIIDAAEREGADLIAMASHGRTGLTQVFYGSVTAGVLHRVDRPLLLVRSSSDG